MRARDKFDSGLVYVWVMTVITWLLTLMAAFAVRGIEALSILGIAIVYSVLNRLKTKHRWIRIVLVGLLILAGIAMILLVYDIVMAYNAAPRQ
ncbi:MAG: hypothetical protein K6T83_07975 [Alicyclobacillus sp.]|nr:hypothetical protein [Alicyclobacillus sp.]